MFPGAAGAVRHGAPRPGIPSPDPSPSTLVSALPRSMMVGPVGRTPSRGRRSPGGVRTLALLLALALPSAPSAQPIDARLALPHAGSVGIAADLRRRPGDRPAITGEAAGLAGLAVPRGRQVPRVLGAVLAASRTPWLLVALGAVAAATVVVLATVLLAMRWAERRPTASRRPGAARPDAMRP